MIRVILQNFKTGEICHGDENIFSEWVSNPDLFVWADFNNVELEKEHTLFREVFDLHPLVISDAHRKRR